MNKVKYPFVSVIVPAYNEEMYIGGCLESIKSQEYPKEKIEIIVVNDGSTDNTIKIIENHKQECNNFRVITQKNSGAAIATNRGIQNSLGDIICLIDSDAVIEKNWMKKIIKEFDDPKVGAVGSNILIYNKNKILAKIMGYDSKYRLWRIKSKFTDHVDTCATAYRREVFEEIGLFNSDFIYGYDVDMSYRIRKAGYTLVLLKDAKIWHHWEETLKGYLKQQFNVAYGRLQVIKKHPEKISGDDSVRIREFLQVPATLLILFSATFSVIFRPLIWFSISMLSLLLIERTSESIGVYRKEKDVPCLFALPVVHILRNVVWCVALVKFMVDEISKQLALAVGGKK